MSLRDAWRGEKPEASAASASTSDPHSHHLCLIIHGIGPHDQKKITRYMTAMKQNCTRILESRFSNSASVQFEFIEWHSTFENIRGSLATAHPATGRVPPTTRLLRHVLEEIMWALHAPAASLRKCHTFCMCDVMFYLVEPHRTTVFDTVCRQANQAARAWKETNPSCAANIHIIAHSLGGLIAYDLVSRGARAHISTFLTFEPSNLFLWGCPLGLFNKLQNTFVPGHVVGSTRIFNIMDACDPVSYRIEDTCDMFIRSGRPLQPPCPVDPLWSLTIARDKMTEKLAVVKDVVRDVKTKLFQIFKGDNSQSLPEQNDSSAAAAAQVSSIEAQRNSAVAAALRSHEEAEGRLDFVLKKTVKEGVNAAFAHRSYWFSKDTMLFCLSNMLQALASPPSHQEEDDSTGLTDSDTDDDSPGQSAWSMKSPAKP